MERYVKLISAVLGMSILLACTPVQTDTKQEIENAIQLEFEEEKSSEVKSEMDFSQGDLYTMFAEVNNEQIENFLYDDYNKDGIHEAFVVTKEQNAYKLWYMSPAECQIVSEDIEYVDNQKTEILGFNTKDYLLLQQSVKGQMNTLVYSVNNDNQVDQANISGKGYIYQNTAGDLFLDVYSEVDEKNIGAQRECITYYLYYVYDDGFREYGAIPIGQEQFLEFAGAQEILDGIHEQYRDSQLEISYLYRANHYININITIYENNRIEYRNMVLRYDDKEVSYVSEELAKGKVEIAHILSVATFPTAFKQPQNNDNR